MTPRATAERIYMRLFGTTAYETDWGAKMIEEITEEIEKGTAVEVMKEKTRGEVVAESFIESIGVGCDMLIRPSKDRSRQMILHSSSKYDLPALREHIAHLLDSEITSATTRERERISAILNVGRAKEDHYLWIAAIDFALRVVEGKK